MRLSAHICLHLQAVSAAWHHFLIGVPATPWYLPAGHHSQHEAQDGQGGRDRHQAGGGMQLWGLIVAAGAGACRGRRAGAAQGMPTQRSLEHILLLPG